MKKQKLRFIIDHIDPLGQGVFKENDQIYFIPKTLPEEEGEFEVIQSRRGVNFGSLNALSKESPKRIVPECPHFNECPGCHFQHTDYETELELKKSSFERMLRSIEFDCPIETVKSSSRFGYRNRIQLHYDLKRKEIGFFDAKKKRIIKISNCIIAVKEVKQALDILLKDDLWIKQAKKTKKFKGHVEIYLHQGVVKVNWNQKYAEGGFSQVNQDTNDIFRNGLKETIGDVASVLDLFAGDGNLSNLIEFNSRKCIDIYTDERQNKEFISLNLFEDNALKDFQKKSDVKKFDTFLIDPPRSGFKHIKSWCDQYEPNKIVYVSCGPQTMIRDLKNLEGSYKITKIQMIDFFASTFHFEACVTLEKIE
jgi:23S rRNA (uracil1939-C5)-methyltransferase